MQHKDREDPQPHHGKGPKEDKGRPIKPHRSSAQVSSSPPRACQLIRSISKCVHLSSQRY